LKLPLDVTQPESINQVVAGTLQQFGRIDVLVNNAGYAVRGAVEETPVEQVQQMFEVNVFGVMRVIQGVAPQMRQQKPDGLSTRFDRVLDPGEWHLRGQQLRWSSERCPAPGADALGIQGVLIEPGSIKTQFHTTVEANAREIFQCLAHQSLPAISVVTADMRRQNLTGGRFEVTRAIEAARPKARYLLRFFLLG
jgi:hypothetical protein